jgi:predicted PhzF superfamily epimerase YddE/YHI9
MRVVKVPFYHVDAFTSRLFAGNPAGVCPLEDWLDAARMQAIAAENNLPETAFFVRTGDCYGLRWFTPAVEVDLCGHATLASAFVIFEHLDRSAREVRFETASGPLVVRREGDLLIMDFPARPPERVGDAEAVGRALGRAPLELWAARDYLAVYGSAGDVRSLSPDMAATAALDRFAVIVTAPGDGDVDFVSRFFAPAQGLPEDPVTGSAHCTLTPYWAARLGKTRLHALQVSPRGGELWCELKGDRVLISGRAVQYLEGAIEIQ